MNFGVRLPGPFRVGVSSRGRVHAGVTLGPFSASTGIGGGRRPADEEAAFYPISLDGAVGELVVMGWRLRGHDGRAAILTSQVHGRLGWLLSGWRAVRIDAVEGGVTWRPVDSTRKTLVWIVVFLVVVAACWGLAT